MLCNTLESITHGQPLAILRKISLFTDDARDLFLTMHLMYTLDEAGNRIYTLKVSYMLTYDPEHDLLVFQKATDSGKITKSAHPGMSPRLSAE